ncbi:unnamed protein product [Lupinus luteus]|uniref:Polygalacturonase n=1 Tax=Lupinus luteus TaxID=3873 RepID=A0AAV1XU28_LUPLU
MNYGADGNAKSDDTNILGSIVAPNKDNWGDVNSPLIRISNVNHLTVDGGGHIEGNGNIWWPCQTCKRPTLLSFHACKDLSVSSLHIANSPGAHISINGCENAKFFKMNINAPGNSPNTDAYDIASSKNVVFEDSTLAVGDDCIAINGGVDLVM